jgi:alpha-ribazole phosphatase
VRLYLIRHPQPAIAAGICYGQSDIGSTEDLDERARALRPLLPDDAPLYTSPLRRCFDLARALCSTPIIDSRLMEMNFGAWEMQHWDAIPRQELDAWAADPINFTPPNGESAAALRLRVAALLRELPATAILVTHGGVLRACAAELAGAADWHQLHFDYGSVSLIENNRLIWKNKRHATPD